MLRIDQVRGQHSLQDIETQLRSTVTAQPEDSRAQRELGVFLMTTGHFQASPRATTSAFLPRPNRERLLEARNHLQAAFTQSREQPQYQIDLHTCQAALDGLNSKTATQPTIAAPSALAMKHLTLASGDEYRGWARGDLFQGEGVLKRADGLTYRSLFIDGQPEGPGSVVWPSGNKVLETTFENGVPHGAARLKLSGDSDATIKVMFRDGAPIKWGVIEHANNTYTGALRHNATPSTVLVGAFTAQGHGTSRYTTGDVYTGQFSDGRPHGQGTFKTRNDAWSGTFNAGVLQGEATRQPLTATTSERWSFDQNGIGTGPQARQNSVSIKL